MEKINMSLIKKHLLFWFPMIFLLVFSIAANATPYLGADITKKGSEYTDISTYPPDEDWSIGDPEIIAYATGWGDPPKMAWVEYTAHLTPGNWNIGLNVINAWYSVVTVPPGYSFSIAYTGGTDPLVIPGSDTEIMNGFFNIDIDSESDYFCVFTWLNDQVDQNYDANLKIMSVFADNTATAPVPEPATMLLLGSGLIGVLGYGRKKFLKK